MCPQGVPHGQTESRGRVLAVIAGARAPRGGVTRQGVVLTDLMSLLDCQQNFSRSLLRHSSRPFSRRLPTGAARSGRVFYRNVFSQSPHRTCRLSVNPRREEFVITFFHFFQLLAPATRVIRVLCVRVLPRRCRL